MDANVAYSCILSECSPQSDVVPISLAIEVLQLGASDSLDEVP